MKDKIIDLQNEFLKIKKIGWIKSIHNGTSGIGCTLEYMLGKEENSFFLPDYLGIELKTKRRYSKGFISLFSVNPDGEYLFPYEYIIDKFGYPDKDFPNLNVFNVSICNLNNNKFKLHVSYEKEKVYLSVYKNGIYNDSSISWSFNLLKERLYLKLSYLAIIMADVKKVGNIEYFRYYDIKFYKIRSFEKFIELIDSGIIRITFKLGIGKSGVKLGKRVNRGSSFDINISNISLLFEEIIL